MSKTSSSHFMCLFIAAHLTDVMTDPYSCEEGGRVSASSRILVRERSELATYLNTTTRVEGYLTLGGL